MSLQEIRTAIKDQKMLCPTCKNPVTKYEKYVDMVASVWDGAGDSLHETAGSKVTLICGNKECQWQERTEFWAQYIN